MLSASSDGPYMSDIAMQPSPTTETMGPFFPSCVVFTIRWFLQFCEFDDCRHIPYNVMMDRNKARPRPSKRRDRRFGERSKRNFDGEFVSDKRTMRSWKARETWQPDLLVI